MSRDGRGLLSSSRPSPPGGYTFGQTSWVCLGLSHLTCCSCHTWLIVWLIVGVLFRVFNKRGSTSERGSFVRPALDERAHPGAGGDPPYRQAACSPAMGRSPAQLSAPQAAVLLAVLALSAAVPGTAAPDRPKEAGPMGCATVDRAVWPLEHRRAHTRAPARPLRRCDRSQPPHWPRGRKSPHQAPWASLGIPRPPSRPPAARRMPRRLPAWRVSSAAHGREPRPSRSSPHRPSHERKSEGARV